MTKADLLQSTSQASDAQRLLSPQAASDYLWDRRGIKRSPRTLQGYRRDGGGPAYRRCGNDVTYTPAALDRWVSEKFGTEVSSTTEEYERRRLAAAEAPR